MKLISLPLIAALTPTILSAKLDPKSKQSEVIIKKETIIPDLQYDDYEIDPECLPDFQGNDLNEEIEVNMENLESILNADEALEVGIMKDSVSSNVKGLNNNGDPVNQFTGSNPDERIKQNLGSRFGAGVSGDLQPQSDSDPNSGLCKNKDENGDCIDEPEVEALNDSDNNNSSDDDYNSGFEAETLNDQDKKFSSADQINVPGDNNVDELLEQMEIEREKQRLLIEEQRKADEKALQEELAKLKAEEEAAELKRQEELQKKEQAEIERRKQVEIEARKRLEAEKAERERLAEEAR